ncbi:MAG: hypothetical protein ABFD10_14195 [Prolixibacteraceae bacterium]
MLGIGLVDAHNAVIHLMCPVFMHLFLVVIQRANHKKIFMIFGFQWDNRIRIQQFVNRVQVSLRKPQVVPLYDPFLSRKLQFEPAKSQKNKERA